MYQAKDIDTTNKERKRERERNGMLVTEKRHRQCVRNVSEKVKELDSSRR